MAADGKHPKFQRQNRAVNKRIKDAWRRPRGIDNKLRIKLKWAGNLPAIGYQGAKATRHLHPCGLPEKIVCNEKELLSLKGKKIAARISATVGAKKREAMKKAASEAKIKILN